MKRKVSLGKTILISILCFVFGIGLTITVLNAFLGEQAKTHFKLLEIDFLADNYFYGDVDKKALDTAICKGYVAALGDKYAKYLPADDAKVNFDSLEGERSGVGVTVTMHPDNKTIYLINVSEDGPAYKAGLRAGDEITSIEKNTVNEENYSKCVDMLVGEIGDVINVTALIDGKSTAVDITVDHFEIQSVFYHTVGKYGYIQITEFNDNTVDQFKIALNTLLDSRVEGLIFDVTGNGGGTVDSVSAILDLLLPEGDIILAEYGDGSTEVLKKSDANEVDLPMAVLTDGYTASAAELFAISLRDYDKATLIGQPTYGKGVMQTTYRLSDGSSVRFTVSKFFSKSKTDFTQGGIIPDTKFTLNEHESKYRYILNDDENPYISRAVDWLNEQ